VAADGADARRLTHDAPGVFSGRPAFLPDGRIVYQSNRDGSTNLWAVPVAGGEPARLTTGPGPEEWPSAARDGTVAFRSAKVRMSLVVRDLQTGQSRVLLSHTSSLWAPAFSPDGSEVAFSRAEAEGTRHIWIVPLRGGPARQLTSGDLAQAYPRWTRDGSAILYHTMSREADRVWLARAAVRRPGPGRHARARRGRRVRRHVAGRAIHRLREDGGGRDPSLRRTGSRRRGA
jgi:Tol biopolymer transport system component